MHQIDLRRIDLNLLPVFEVLMQERSVSRAAIRLGRTQSAISHALDRLRQQLGDPLLVRLDGAMQPSPFALDLIEELHPLLRSMQRALAPKAAFDPATSRRVFRVVMPDFWYGAIAGFLAHAARHAPGIALEWIAPNDASLADTLAAQVDLVVAPSIDGHVDGIRSMRLGGLAWQSFMRRGHPALRRWGHRAWLAHPHIVVRVSGRTVSPVPPARTGAGPGTGASPGTASRRIGAHVPAFSAVAPLLARTDMIATLPTLAIGDAARHYDLQTRPPPHPIPLITQSLFWSARHENDPALKWLRATLAPLITIA